jgi:hypothetical protein
MSLPRFKAKRDASEKAIVKALECMGVFVWRLDTPVDLLCIYRREVFLVEIKTPGKNAKRKQANQELIAQHCNLFIFETPEDAIATMKAVRFGSRRAA